MNRHSNGAPMTARSTLACLLVTAALPSALAQSNSLFGGRGSAPQPRPVPTTQPARPMLPPVSAGPRSRPLPPANPMDDVPQNPILLAYSPIAVAAPKRERIGVGHLVTIIVRESKQALTDARIDSLKEWEITAELRKWFRLDKDDKLVPQTFQSGTPGVDFTSEDQYRGNGRYNRNDQLTTRITATVIDVKPNGTLTLEARKSIKVDEERQNYTLTGVCRSEDLTPQNTLLSTQIADLIVEVEHTGATRDATRRSWFKRIADLLRLS